MPEKIRKKSTQPNSINSEYAIESDKQLKRTEFISDSYCIQHTRMPLIREIGRLIHVFSLSDVLFECVIEIIYSIFLHKTVHKNVHSLISTDKSKFVRVCGCLLFYLYPKKKLNFNCSANNIYSNQVLRSLKSSILLVNISQPL